ncbi:MAG: hypothetical protein M3680_06530 [Myxococcota bacterium]|nr:hypothetical protein [Myxococcota bacterium]
MWRSLCCLAVVGCGFAPAGVDAVVAPADALTDAPPDAEICGRRGGARGASRREVTIDGLRRTYLVYLPASASATTPLPLVFVHHGYTMSGQAMFDITDYATLADTEHIALVFPDGQGGPNTNAAPWNVGTELCPSSLGPPPSATGDDFAMLDAIQADLSEDQCLDREHVFVTGFSMGGYFAHHAGCMREDIAGIAPHSGGTHPLDTCASTTKPVIIFHGLADTLIPAGCNDPAAPAVQNVVPAATAWAQRNGCALTSRRIDVAGGTCRVYDDCPAGGQVALCTFTGMGHCWAGGKAGSGLFACPLFAKATALEWAFFKEYAW